MYENIIGKVIMGEMDQQEGMDKCTLLLLIQKQIFCPISEEIMDINKSILWTDGTRDVALNPKGWEMTFKKYNCIDAKGFLAKAGGRFYPTIPGEIKDRYNPNNPKQMRLF